MGIMNNINSMKLYADIELASTSKISKALGIPLEDERQPDFNGK